MPTTQTHPAIPTTTLTESDLAPDEGYVRMPCCESVEDTFDAVMAHVSDCWECQRNL